MVAGVLLVEIDVRGLERQPSAVGHRIAGVDRQIDQDLFDLAAIEPDRRQVRRREQFEVDVLADAAARSSRRTCVRTSFRLMTFGLMICFRGEREQLRVRLAAESAALSTLIEVLVRSGSIGCISIRRATCCP